MIRAITITFLALLTFLGVFGCGGGAAGGSGTLRVFLADAPLPGVTSLVITIDRIEAHHEGTWKTINSEPQVIDLLELTQHSMVIASGGLPAGEITQIRLFLTSATVTDSQGTHNVTIPSGAQTGIKLNIDAMVEPNTVTQVLLDFNVEQSLVLLGNGGGYILTPVIPAVLMDLAGTVTGSVTLSGEPVHGALVRAVYTAGPNYALGTEVNTSTTAEDGTFKVWALLEGTYTIETTFTDAADVEYAASVENVVVTRGNNTAVGAIALVAVP